MSVVSVNLSILKRFIIQIISSNVDNANAKLVFNKIYF